MMQAMRTTTTLFLILLPFLAAQAQDDTVEEVQEIRRYTVEMIIFRYAQEVSAGSEIFPGDEPVRETLPVDGEDPLAAEALEEIPKFVRAIELVTLDKEDLAMGEIMGRLERLEAYVPLMHFGWTQTTWPEEQTRAIELASVARPPAGLDGSLTLYLTRYLHLVVDLQLDAPDAVNSNNELLDPMSGYGDYRTLDEFGDIVRPGPVRYRIQENRIVKNGELRYFDHPKFGVIAKVTRVEEEPAEMPEADDTELLGYPAE